MTKLDHTSMPKSLKLITVGNSTGVILPKQLLAWLRVGRGDSLFASQGPDGSIRLSPYDPELAQQMEIAETIMRQDRDILRILAK